MQAPRFLRKDIAGLPCLIALPVGVVLMLGFLMFMKKRQTA